MLFLLINKTLGPAAFVPADGFEKVRSLARTDPVRGRRTVSPLLVLVTYELRLPQEGRTDQTCLSFFM